MSKELRLTIELVPNPLWGNNLRKYMSKSAWEKLRKQVMAQHNNRCGICQAVDGRLYCHEIWQYDDIAHIQKLNGFIILCEMCNHCKHMGLTKNLAAQGKLNLSNVIDHFMRINQCSHEEYQAHENEAFKIWNERNKYEWTTDFDTYAHLVPPTT